MMTKKHPDPRRPFCLDLFAGAGGASLGLARAGYEVVHVERDHDACATLRAAFPSDEVVEDDVRRVSFEQWSRGEVELLWSSFPCQCWSTAGAREGARDTERNGWPWTVAAIDAARPKWVILENVPGLLVHRGGSGKCNCDPLDCPRCYFNEVIVRQLAQRFGWVGHRIIDAADHGVPQHRKRVIIAAGPRDLRWPEPTHCDPSHYFSRLLGLAPFVTAVEALELGAQARIVGGGHNPNVAGDKRRYRDITDEPSTTITAVQIGNAGPFVVEPATKNDSTRKSSRARVARSTKRSGIATDLSTNTDAEVRPLTIRERATLQGFPADHPFQGTATSRNRQIGNALPPVVAQRLGAAVLWDLDLLATSSCSGTSLDQSLLGVGRSGIVGGCPSEKRNERSATRPRPNART